VCFARSWRSQYPGDTQTMCGTLPLKITQSLEFLHFGIPGLALLEACRLGVVGFAQPRTVPVYDGINFELVWDGAAGKDLSLTGRRVSSLLPEFVPEASSEGGPMIGKNLDPAALRADRAAGMTLMQLAQKHDCSP